MKRSSLVIAAATATAVAVALSSLAGWAKPPASDGAGLKGLWRVLVKPKSKWVLKNGEGKDTIVVETYDERKVGAADVARLRWTHVNGKDKRDLGNSDNGLYTQVAVTDAGLYVLSADMDDAAVQAALAKKASRSDPPKAYEGTKQNQGRYLHVNKDSICWGNAPWQPDFECPDTCDGWVCIDAGGVSEIAGTKAPGYNTFTR